MVFRLKTRLNMVLFQLFAIMLCNQSSAYGKPVRTVAAETSEQFVSWTYKETPMGLYLPAKTDKPLPIVMFLHGCHNDPVSRYHWIISALNAIEPCAVFLPTAPETKNTQYPCADWGGTYDNGLRPQMTNALTVLDSLITTHNFDTQRQYLYGESMGGEGIYRLLSDFPSRFAGAVNVAGYTLNKGAAKMAKTPLWIITGASDEVSPVDSNKAIYNSIQNAGGTMVKYTEYPGLSHAGGIEQAREESGLLEWLLSQKRSTAVIKRTGMRNDALRENSLFEFSHGNLQISPRLPSGSVVTLFDFNGQVLFKTDTRNTSVRLPARTISRVVLWNVSNAEFSVSGKTSLCQK